MTVLEILKPGIIENTNFAGTRIIYASITPKIAEELKNFDKRNRRPSKKYIDDYVLTMNAGLWNETPALNYLAFCKDNKGREWLANGGHRLSALIKANRTIKFTILLDLPENILEIIDAPQKKRSIADHYKLMYGENITAACSALIKTYNFYNTNPDKRDASLPDATIHGNYKNYQEVITLVENDFDDCIEASRIGSRTKSSLKGGSQGAFGAAWMILKDLDRNKANQFFEELIDEHTHKPDSPLKILHRTFYQSRGRIYHYKTLSLIFSAWNSWLNNENRKTLRVPPIVPEPIKP